MRRGGRRGSAGGGGGGGSLPGPSPPRRGAGGQRDAAEGCFRAVDGDGSAEGSLCRAGGLCGSRGGKTASRNPSVSARVKPGGFFSETKRRWSRSPCPARRLGAGWRRRSPRAGPPEAPRCPQHGARREPPHPRGDGLWAPSFSSYKYLLERVTGRLMPPFSPAPSAGLCEAVR